ncbi:hypothetical protein GCM10007422_13790 [Pedobacter zeae]|uniref:Uncharacterized protein n=1 Tax=Pedobacter zeae TaxID=1737356 RepID=A0ABQ1XQW4_9SPHI|nr:hypothetical protein GCM10007422_13790 [Pedobacter zeae]
MSTMYELFPDTAKKMNAGCNIKVMSMPKNNQFRYWCALIDAVIMKKSAELPKAEARTGENLMLKKEKTHEKMKGN